MGFEFVIGGCGTGKSRSLYERAICDGGRYVFLVPDQSTSQVQQELLRLHPRHVISGIDVAGFTQYAYRTFERTGLEAPTVLDDVGKKMILRRVIESVKGELKVYHGQVGRNGFTEKMKSFLSECRQYKINPERLGEVIEKESSNRLLCAKLSDVRRIMEAFDLALGEQYTTAEELMFLLAGRIGKDPLVKQTTFVLDGFTGFTPIQYDVIKELLHHSHGVIVVLTARSMEDLTGKNAEKGLFALSSVTYRKISELLDREGVIAKETVLDNTEWGRHPAITYAAQRFGFGRGTLKAKDEDERERLLGEALSLNSYSDIRSEVRAAARAIRADVVERSLRYQEIAVTLTDPDLYAPIIEEIFPEYQIPYFIDRKRDLSANPLIAYLETALSVLEEDFGYGSVFACIRTGFTGLTPAETDLLENFVLATGKRGFKSWNKTWVVRSKRNPQSEEEMKVINRARAKLVKLFKPLSAVVGDSSTTVRERLTAIYEFLVSSEVPQKLEEQKQNLSVLGMQDLEREYEQVYRKVIGVISLFEKLMGDEVLSPESFSDILSEGLSEQKIGLVPPSLDRLVVGDLTRTRYGSVRRLYVLGMNENLIPSSGSEGGVLSRYERNALQEELEMAPTAKEKIRQQEYYCYLLFMKPTEHLSVSCSLGTDSKEAGKPSPYMTRLMRLFAQFQNPDQKPVTNRCGMEEIGAPDADRSLLVKAFFGPREAWYQALYDSFQSMPSYEHFVRLMEQGVTFEYHSDSLCPETASALFPKDREVSVSRLETFAGCEYAYFLKYTLGLSEREIFRFRPVDFGNLCHDILDGVFRQMQKEGLSWRQLTDEGSDEERKRKENLRKRLVDSCLENADFLSSYQGLEEDSAMTAVMLEKSRSMIDLCMSAVASQLSLGSFEQVGSEIGFGRSIDSNSGDRIPPLEVISPEGEKIFLQGKIDRLDTARTEDGCYYQVVDYKTGQKKFEYEKFLAGTQLQLIIYLMAAKDYLKRTAAEGGDSSALEGGMYYFHLQEAQVDFDSEYREDPTEWERKARELAMKDFKLNGCLVQTPAYLELLCRDPENVKRIVAGLSRTPAPGNHFYLEPERMEQMEEKAKETVSKLVGSIRNGRIQINPILGAGGNDKGTCGYCPMKTVCKFNPDMKGFSGRRLKKG